jgi:hypothetical protein
VLVTQAYRFALDPTPAQQRALVSDCGASRFAYNWGLRLVKDRLDERERVRDATNLNARTATLGGDPAGAAAGAVRLALLPDDGPTGQLFSWDGTVVPW